MRRKLQLAHVGAYLATLGAAYWAAQHRAEPALALKGTLGFIALGLLVHRALSVPTKLGWLLGLSAWPAHSLYGWSAADLLRQSASSLLLLGCPLD